jgi:hypothetical protein
MGFSRSLNLRRQAKSGEAKMPRFYFDLTNGHRVPDQAGLDCDDAPSAQKMADRIASDIGRETSTLPKKHLTVVNEEGEDIYRARIPEGRGHKK